MDRTSEANSVVFVGNCQAAALTWAYNKYVAPVPSEHAIFFDGRTLTAAQRQVIAGVDTVVLQVADKNHEAVQNIKDSRGRTVLFPYVSGSFIWPYGTESHLGGKEPPLSEFGAFSEELGGDRFLNMLMREGNSPQRSVEAYLELDVVATAKVDHRFDISQRLQRARDERSDLSIAPYIEFHLAREHLFASRGHPCSGLFTHLAIQVFERLGATSAAIENMRQDQPGPLDHEWVPIHPSVRGHFGLVRQRLDGKYLFNMVLHTFEDYVCHYVLRDCDPDLLRGRQLFQAGQVEMAENCLLRGLRRSPNSPEGERLLSHVYSQMKRHDDALAAAQRALSMDPYNLQSLLFLAQFYLARRNFNNAFDHLRLALCIHPGCLDARRLQQLAESGRQRFGNYRCQASQ